MRKKKVTTQHNPPIKVNQDMKVLTLIFALVFSVAANAEGVVFKIVSDNGSVFNFRDSSCPNSNFFRVVGVEPNGRMHLGCYVVDDEERVVAVAWPGGVDGLRQYSFDNIEVTKYGERYFDPVTMERQ